MSTEPRFEQGSGNALCVSLPKPPEVRLADWMSQLRNWLDHQGIEPTGFRFTTGALGIQSCEMTFPDRAKADLFVAEFHSKHLR